MLTPFTCRACHRRTYHEHLRHLPAEARLLLAIFNDRLCARCARIGIRIGPKEADR